MKVHGKEKLCQTARWLNKKFPPGAIILLYHRVAELPSDPYLLCVTPQHFAEHLEVLRKHYYSMGLRQLVQAVKEGNIPRLAMVITFDDGYADNLYNAKPLLEKYGIPATVFVTSGYVGRECEFWWDELDRIFLQPGQLPETLRLSIKGSIYEWQLGEVGYYSKQAYQRHRGWSIWEKNDPTQRHFLIRSLYQLIRPLAQGEQRKVLNQLLVLAGKESTGRSAYRVLSPDEVVRLAEDGLIEVGAHTVTHPVLSVLPVGEQRDEIQRSKVILEEILGCSVTSFAYSFGQPADYTSETVKIVRESGFASACLNFAGIVEPGVNYFQLPRIVVYDWDGDAFMRHLEFCLGKLLKTVS